MYEPNHECPGGVVSIVENNQQSIVPKRFAELREKSKKDVEKLIDLFINESALVLLPLEMWQLVISFVLPTEYDAHFIFLRKDICYQDTYYMFVGTETRFNESMAILKQEVIDIQLNSRAIEDDLLDTPIDTFCNIDHFEEEDGRSCPDEFGHQCACQWHHSVYDTEEAYLSDYRYAVEQGNKNSYFKRACEIRHI